MVRITTSRSRLDGALADARSTLMLIAGSAGLLCPRWRRAGGRTIRGGAARVRDRRGRADPRSLGDVAGHAVRGRAGGCRGGGRRLARDPVVRRRPDRGGRPGERRAAPCVGHAAIRAEALGVAGVGQRRADLPPSARLRHLARGPAPAVRPHRHGADRRGAHAADAAVGDGGRDRETSRRSQPQRGGAQKTCCGRSCRRSRPDCGLLWSGSVRRRRMPRRSVAMSPS